MVYEAIYMYSLIPKPPLYFAAPSASVYYTEHKPGKKKTGEAWERGYYMYMYICSVSWVCLV